MFKKIIFKNISYKVNKYIIIITVKIKQINNILTKNPFAKIRVKNAKYKKTALKIVI